MFGVSLALDLWRFNLEIMSQVEVVLFVKGKGCDPSSFQPRRDESQWWNRRDALVRCVAAFLFGPHSKNVEKSLILLFDEDWSRIYLKLAEGYTEIAKNFVPTEQNVIGALRKVAEDSPGTSVVYHGLQATLILSENMDTSDLPSTLSRRSILEHMQRTCSMDFLREHGLNSSTAAILKKNNKQKLNATWKAWLKRKEKAKKHNLKDSLTPILLDVLVGRENDKDTQTIAGMLHESGDAELPVWCQWNQGASTNSRTVLFLGAVRDMLPVENECLTVVCREKAIPLTKIRLGSVPEFTSKILSIVAFHAANGVLWSGIQDLVCRNERKRPRRSNEAPASQSPSTTLEVVCFVPIDTEDLVTNLEARTRILWCLVRCCVVTLWRSKVHASTTACPLVNRLHLMFQDGTRLSLQQDELVAELAEQHQAAPCEYQILDALRKRVMDVKKTPTSPVDWSREGDLLAKLIRKESRSPFRVVSAMSRASRNFARDFYGCERDTTDSGTFVLLQTLGTVTSWAESFREALISGFTIKEDSDVVAAAVDGSFCGNCADIEAASITMMQHIAYQGRLSNTFASNSSKVAKKDVLCGQGAFDDG